MKSFYFYLLLTTLIFACQPSSQDNHASEDAENSETIPTQSESEIEPEIESPEKIGTIFMGKIDHKYPITVNLVRTEDELSGSYYYDKIGKSISLTGQVLGETSILEETDDTGAITGRWEIDTDDLTGWIYGTWMNPQTKKEMHLDLTEVDPRIWKNKLKSPWNGVWTDGIGTLEFRMLAPDTLYFHHFSMNAREHMGELTGELVIKNNQAWYQDDLYGTGGEDICKVSYLKSGDTIQVKQETSNDCGAGQGVYFDGKYVQKAQYDAYWEAKPLAEKIGDDRVWQFRGSKTFQYLHLKADGNFTWTTEAEGSDDEQSGTWQTEDKSTLSLAFDPDANVREWKVVEVSTFYMTISRNQEEVDFRLLGYQ